MCICELSRVVFINSRRSSVDVGGGANFEEKWAWHERRGNFGRKYSVDNQAECLVSHLDKSKATSYIWRLKSVHLATWAFFCYQNQQWLASDGFTNSSRNQTSPWGCNQPNMTVSTRPISDLRNFKIYNSFLDQKNEQRKVFNSAAFWRNVKFRSSKCLT